MPARSQTSSPDTNRSSSKNNSKKASEPTAQQKAQHSRIEAIHTEVYGALFTKGTVAVEHETIQLVLNREQATALYDALSEIFSYPEKLRPRPAKLLAEVEQMLLAAKVDRTPLVFELRPFTVPHVMQQPPEPTIPDDEDNLF